MATLVNYTGKSFIKLTPGLLRTNPGSQVLRSVKDSAAFTTIFPL